MIDISVREGEIKACGHACYAPAELDIVCSAVSTLLQVLVKSIEDLAEDKMEYVLESGNAFIKYGNLSEKSKTLVDSFFIGVCMVADAYPKYVRIV